MALMSGGGRKLRILIPCHEPGGPSAEVYPHWEAKIFTIAAVTDQGIDYKVIRRNEDLVVTIAKREKVNYAIAKSLSTRALELMRKIGVTVCTGDFNSVNEAVEKFIKGELHALKICKEKLIPPELKP